MIAPLLHYSITGVIWYQGESNTKKPAEYESLFRSVIKDWRTNWSQGEFPFLYVQLANFMQTYEQPSESNWAAVRESQRKTLSTANTAMVVAIDVGEWNDIHPLNKKTIGERLALAAEKIAYRKKNIVHSGPILKSYSKHGNKIILTFSNTGSGLVSKGGQKLKYFSIAGPDKKFVWAEAVIKGDEIIVWSDQVDHPVVVRYAWADNPEGANLYNVEGLPASPFSTE
jgi:sialate O-acetylesterase